MSVGIRLGMVGASLLLGSLMTGSPRAAQAQQGAIGGQVVDEAAGTPLEAARVLLTGTGQIETTNREGRFLFRQVAPGTYQVRVLRVGYKPATQSTTVAAGETAALSFSLAPAVVQLDELVTTATGQQRKLEIGNAVTTIDAAKVAEHQQRQKEEAYLDAIRIQARKRGNDREHAGRDADRDGQRVVDQERRRGDKACVRSDVLFRDGVGAAAFRVGKNGLAVGEGDDGQQ